MTTVICANLKLLKFSTKWKQIRDFSIYHVVFSSIRVIILDSLDIENNDGGH